MNKLQAFFQQPLNQGALAAIAGTGLAVLNGSITWQHAAPVAIGAIVAWILPDNSIVKEDIEVVVADAIKAIADVRKDVK